MGFDEVVKSFDRACRHQLYEREYSMTATSHTLLEKYNWRIWTQHHPRRVDQSLGHAFPHYKSTLSSEANRAFFVNSGIGDHYHITPTPSNVSVCGLCCGTMKLDKLAVTHTSFLFPEKEVG